MASQNLTRHYSIRIGIYESSAFIGITDLRRTVYLIDQDGRIPTCRGPVTGTTGKLSEILVSLSFIARGM